MGQELVSRLLGTIDKGLDRKTYQELHWEGTFEDYLKLVAENPRIARNAFQRVYDMILSYGAENTSRTASPSPATTSSATPWETAATRSSASKSRSCTS
jgi:predicted Ser/Thr protein kinase